jgi:hypothetical protein
MDDIRYKVNIIAAIAALGAVIALIGTILSYIQFPVETGILDLIIFILLVVIAIANIRPSVNTKNAILNVVIGILAIVISGILYINIGDSVDAQTFMDVGIGVWLMFAGSIIFTIFTISDLTYKRKS